jgi:hypothetical protein
MNVTVPLPRDWPLHAARALYDVLSNLADALCLMMNPPWANSSCPSAISSLIHN